MKYSGKYIFEAKNNSQWEILDEIMFSENAELKDEYRFLFRMKTKTRKAFHLTMVTTYGLKTNAYSSMMQNDVTSDDLFIDCQNFLSFQKPPSSGNSCNQSQGGNGLCRYKYIKVKQASRFSLSTNRLRNVCSAWSS